MNDMPTFLANMTITDKMRVSTSSIFHAPALALGLADGSKGGVGDEIDLITELVKDMGVPKVTGTCY